MTRPLAGDSPADEAARPPAPLSVAPMMDLTDRHLRYLLRQISRGVLLYSEMITARAVLRGDRERLLACHPAEAPVALQLGGDDPGELARAGAIGAEFGYTQLNLNVGCPSERVSSGNFGACLMADPELVGDCVAAMAEASGLPVTVKHRIGIDERDSYADLLGFVDDVNRASGGSAAAFIVHARKAWLKGLSPKQNRSVPPLRQAEVYRLKRERPELVIELNGGVRSLDEAAAHLAFVDGVMIGRAVCDDPLLLAGVDARFYGAAAAADHDRIALSLAVVRHMLPYLEERLSEGVPLTAMTRHLLSLFRGVPGGRAWRRTLTEGAHLPGAGPELITRALRAFEAGPSPLASMLEAGEVLAGDDQVLDLVGAFADAR